MLSVLLDVTIIFALSAVAIIICHRLKLPSSVGMLLAGVLAGPDALGLIRHVDSLETFSEIGVVLLLFIIGLEFSIADIGRLKREFLIGGSIQFFGTALVIGLATLFMGESLSQSVYLGFIVSLSSTAIVLKMLQDHGEVDSPHGKTTLAMLIYQDIAVVPVMLMAPLLAGGGPDAGGVGLTEVGQLVGTVAAVALGGYLLYRWGVPFLLERVARTHSSEAFLLGVITICLGIAGLTQSLGLSLALGAFLAGIIVSESAYSQQAVTVMLPFRDVFMSLFFVSTGMLLDIQYLAANPWLIAALTLGLLTIKPLVATVAALFTGLSARGAVLSGFALGQLGEFSLVAARTGVSAGLFGNDVFQTVLDTAVLSMVLTPVLVAVAPHVATVLERTGLDRALHRTRSAEDLEDAHDYAGHVLIVGFGVTGRNLAHTAELTAVPYVILEMNADTVRRAADEGEPIHYGDASQETILRHVDADKARAIVVVINSRMAARRIVETARRVAPDAYILVRSRYLAEVEMLLTLGADEVIADELEVSIEVFSRVLSRMLVPREDIKRMIGEVRGDWRRMSRTLSKEATSVKDLHVVVPDLTTHTLRISDHSSLLGKSIAESRLRAEHGVTVLAVTRDGVTTSNPHSDLAMRLGDEIFVIGPLDWDPTVVL